MTMPDGSQTLRDIDAACARMHDRLIAWGRLYLAGGNGPRHRWDSDDEREYFDYRPHDYDDVRKLNTMVLQLPKKQQSLTLAAFYVNDKICSVWDELSAHRKATIMTDLADTINFGIRAVNSVSTIEWLPVLACDVDAIRLRAIKQLVNREQIGK